VAGQPALSACARLVGQAVVLEQPRLVGRGQLSVGADRERVPDLLFGYATRRCQGATVARSRGTNVSRRRPMIPILTDANEGRSVLVFT